ncbi:MAG: tetratricopeptide repeat protein [Bernardetiaceae bacterium]
MLRWIVFLWLFPIVGLWSHPYADSLRVALSQHPQKDTTKVRLLLLLSDAFRDNTPDTALAYANSALTLSQSLQHTNGTAEALLQIGVIFRGKSDYIAALDYFEQARQHLNTPEMQARWANNVGIIYELQGDLGQTLQYYQQALDIYDSLQNIPGIAQTINNIGIIHAIQEDYPRALTYFYRAVALRQQTGQTRALASSYNNIGLIHEKMHQLDSALHWHYQSLDIKEKLNNRSGIATSYINIANIHIAKGQYAQGLGLLKQAIDIYQQLDQPRGIALAKTKRADAYLSMGGSLGKLRNEYYTKALREITEAQRISRQIGDVNLQKDVLEVMVRTYEKIGATAQALAVYRQFVQIKDSLFNLEQIRYTREIESRYQIKEHRQQIQWQQQQLQQQENEIQRQQRQRNFLIVATLMSFVLIGLIYRGYYIKQEANQKLRQKNQYIHQQNEEIQAQKDRLQAQQVILENTLSENRRQNNNITDSIRYAQDIQHGLLPRLSDIEAAFAESFLLFLPKDIVSGDFYWFLQVDQADIPEHTTEDYRFLAVVDCTGHGVPGAFMSMIAHTLLNEIVQQMRCYDPAMILAHLDQEIKKTLHSTTTSNRDGMDISLCRFEGRSVVFAGAKQAIYYLDCGQAQQNPKKLRGDRHSIGGRVRKRSTKMFHNQRLDLRQGGIVYLLSDGYIDQSNPDLERFGSMRFENLLRLICPLPLSKQAEIIRETLKQHQQDTEQRDDITVLGVRV